MNKPDRRVLLPIPDAQKLLAYLAERPYKEVAPLVQALSSAPMGDVQAPADPEPAKDAAQP